MGCFPIQICVGGDEDPKACLEFLRNSSTRLKTRALLHCRTLLSQFRPSHSTMATSLSLAAINGFLASRTASPSLNVICMLSTTAAISPRTQDHLKPQTCSKYTHIPLPKLRPSPNTVCDKMVHHHSKLCQTSIRPRLQAYWHTSLNKAVRGNYP